MREQQGLKQTQPSHAAAILAAEDKVIEQGKIDCFGSTSKPSRGVAIVLARTAVPTGVIVGQKDAGATEPCCIDDDIPYRKGHGSGIAVVAFEMDTASAIVNVGHPKALQ